jgi:hypothetical protein
MFDSMTCILPTIDPNLGVTLSNLTELDKVALWQDVGGLHVASRAHKKKEKGIAL